MSDPISIGRQPLKIEKPENGDIPSGAAVEEEESPPVELVPPGSVNSPDRTGDAVLGDAERALLAAEEEANPSPAPAPGGGNDLNTLKQNLSAMTQQKTQIDTQITALKGQLAPLQQKESALDSEIAAFRGQQEPQEANYKKADGTVDKEKFEADKKAYDEKKAAMPAKAAELAQIRAQMLPLKEQLAKAETASGDLALGIAQLKPQVEKAEKAAAANNPPPAQNPSGKGASSGIGGFFKSIGNAIGSFFKGIAGLFKGGSSTSSTSSTPGASDTPNPSGGDALKAARQKVLNLNTELQTLKSAQPQDTEKIAQKERELREAIAEYNRLNPQPGGGTSTNPNPNPNP